MSAAEDKERTAGVVETQPGPIHRPDELTWGFTFVILLTGAVVLSANKSDPDLWGHVLYGQELLRDGLPARATHTFTAPNHPWINHENLAEIVFAAVVNVVGGRGLVWLACVFALVTISLFVRSAQRQQASLLTTCVVVILACLNMSASWNIRPQLFSFFLFALLIALLNRAFRTNEAPPDAPIGIQQVSRWLWCTPVLMAIWANSHGGFLAGCAVLFLYLGCRSVEAICRHGKQAAGAVWGYVLIATASGLATLINPYGWKLHAWLAGSLGQPRPEISEWAALSPSDELFLPFILLLALCVFSLVAGRERRDWAQVAVMAVVAWQSIIHLRHIPFFAVVAGFWLPRHVEGIRQRFLVDGDGSESKQAIVAGGWDAAARQLAWLIVVALALRLGWRERNLFVDTREYPVAAVQFMAEHRLEGRLVVFFDWAQYVMAAFEDKTSVAFDGRFRTCYPQSVVDMHFDFIHGDVPGMRHRDPASGPIDGERVLEFGDPELVLISRRFRHARAIMQRRSDWTLFYQDELAQVWGRRDRFDDPARRGFVPPSERSIREKSDGLPELVPWPAFPKVN